MKLRFQINTRQKTTNVYSATFWMQVLHHARQVSGHHLATRNYSSKVFWQENTTLNLQKNGPSVTSDFPGKKKKTCFHLYSLSRVASRGLLFHGEMSTLITEEIPLRVQRNAQTVFDTSYSSLVPFQMELVSVTWHAPVHYSAIHLHLSPPPPSVQALHKNTGLSHQKLSST